MKIFYLTSLLIIAISFNCFSQTTTLTEDANGVLNTSKIVAQTSSGQIFYIGHQLGSGYFMPSGIFRAITDNPGGLNYFYDGVSGTNTTFSVRSDGQGYFAGKLGVGTSSPISDLHIWEPTDSKPGGVVAPTISVLKLTRNGTPSYSYNESAEFRIGHGGPSVWGSQLDLFLNGASNISNIPDQRVMTWLYNGNVGIGTANPTSRLTLAGGGNPNPNTGSEVDYGGLSLTFRGENGGGNYDLGNIKMVQPSGTNVDHADMVFLTTPGGGNLTEKLRINGAGNVSIGTTNSNGYKLAVNGSAIATSMTVKLYANWPDYVFKKDYQLPTLQEVKTYIDQNHHLPEVPSEQQIAKDGLNLGEMNKILTKKVEELTLYLIELNKQMKEQQKEIDQLKNRQ